MTSTTTVLLCTYNGENHLNQQLDSILNQSIDNINVLASDDGSSDNTLAILEKYKLSWTKGYFNILAGPQKGFADNFLSLTFEAKSDSAYFAFCDQDDIWNKNKLETAIAFLKTKNELPSLYCSRTENIDESGKELKTTSPLFQKEPSFANALVQSIAGGNTMVFNKKALQLLQAAGTQKVISHDWWAYLLISGAGGSTLYDPQPQVKYRQHNKNLIGANVSFLARTKRLKMLTQGTFRDWNTVNINALQNNRDHLNPASKEILDTFITARRECLFKRLYLFQKSKVHRQTTFGNIALMVAVFLKKI